MQLNRRRAMRACRGWRHRMRKSWDEIRAKNGTSKDDFCRRHVYDAVLDSELAVALIPLLPTATEAPSITAARLPRKCRTPIPTPSCGKTWRLMSEIEITVTHHSNKQYWCQVWRAKPSLSHSNFAKSWPSIQFQPFSMYQSKPESAVEPGSISRNTSSQQLTWLSDPKLTWSSC